MGPPPPLPLLLVLFVLVAGATAAAKDSSPNILRIPKSKATAGTISTTAGPTIVLKSERKDLSRSNPELDWKTSLKNAVEKLEEQHHRYDLDFIKDGLSTWGNSAQWLVDLYDPLSWTKIPGNVSQDCRDDLQLYLRSLRNGDIWAARLFDSSGRYSSQYHFGNGFWLGSSTQCKELNGTEFYRDVKVNSTIDTANKNKTIWFYQEVNETLPFLVQFHVARMLVRLPSDVEDTERQIFIGLCLPISCKVPSVYSILRAGADRIETNVNRTQPDEGLNIKLAQIRKIPSSDYTPWKDPKFFALAAVTSVTLFLMICSTIYEYRTGEFNSGGSGSSSNVRGDAESASLSNNNVRKAEYADKNLAEAQTISIGWRIDSRISHDGHDNDKDLIDKTGHHDLPKSCSDAARKKDLERPAKSRGLLVSCLLAFSPMSNGSKIMSTEPAAKNSLTCLHGLRVLSLGWVILVHTYLMVFSIAENKNLRTVTERNFLFQTISNATFSVDTFFFISGLLVTVLFYRSAASLPGDKAGFAGGSSRKFVNMILYRFVRLTPSYLFVLMVNLITMKYSMTTTVFSPQIIDHYTCEHYWWRNVLYVNSLYPRKEMCMMWSWYMANDMQFYVLGIFLLMLSLRYFRAVAGAVVGLTVLSWLTTFVIAFSHDYVAKIQEPFALFDELYDKPWLRAGPYFVGMMAGYLLFKTNCKIKTSCMFRTLGWVISPLVMCSLVYGLYPGNLSVTVSSLYASLGHTAWALAVGFMVVQCCCGGAPLIDRLLSLRIIYPLSRLTYCAYLVHPVLMMYVSTRMDGPLHLHNGIVLIVYFGNCVASYLAAFCISLVYEAPVVNLLKIMLGPKKRTR